MCAVLQMEFCGCSVKYVLNVCVFSEVDYVCMDLMPRHHNIIRWRMGESSSSSSSSSLSLSLALPHANMARWGVFTNAASWTRFFGVQTVKNNFQLSTLGLGLRFWVGLTLTVTPNI